jgi:hypothetical protein
MFQLLDRGTVTVQPAGSAGKRHVFLTLAFEADENPRQVEFVLSEWAAHQLGRALTSGSVGIMREFDLSADGSEAGIRMAQNFCHLPPDEQIIVLVTAAVLRQAQNLIAFCEYCDSENAELLFDNLLDRITGSDPTRTEYVLEVPARCPNCRRDVFGKTLVVPHFF